jgi:hypothetical protein
MSSETLSPRSIWPALLRDQHAAASDIPSRLKAGTFIVGQPAGRIGQLWIHENGFPYDQRWSMEA